MGAEIRSGTGGSVVYAVPDFVATSPDLGDIGRTLGQVLWDDLNFEREFRMLPRDVSATVARIAPGAQPVFPSWRELGVDALVSASVTKVGDDIQVEYRLFNVTGQRAVMAQAIKVSARSSPRVLAHAMSDAIFKQQRNLRGVARTKIAFVSDRNREPLIGTVEKREAKEIYMMDYDGANDQRLTVTRNLNINPTFAPDAKSIAYTSYSSGRADVIVSHFTQGLLQRPVKGAGNDYLPAISPDGSKIAFTSDRNGNMEIYIANVDGSNLRRVTNNPSEDSVPTWSPSGEQIAFTSDRSGRPQVYAMNIDGTGVRLISNGGETEADRATWSPAPFNEIALSAKHGSWYDLKIYDVAAGTSRWLTNNAVTGGSNESPAFSPTGRHLAYTSTRTGSKQIWVIGRDGTGERQLTRSGNNQTPTWSPN